MKIRIKFKKYGNMKFVGHLDVMRYFQKAVRRADVDIRYSEGFSPHQVMSFAAPLGVGSTGSGEYMDIEVLDTDDPKTMHGRLSAQMAEGFEIVSCRRLPDTAGNAMSVVAAADYTLRLRPGYGPENTEEWLKGLLEFYGRDSILVTKKTKRGQAELNLKPLVYELKIIREEDRPVLFMKISTGSVSNIKPDLVLDAYYHFLGQERPDFAWMAQREEVYADLASDGDKERGAHRFVSLEELGEEIK